MRALIVSVAIASATLIGEALAVNSSIAPVIPTPVVGLWQLQSYEVEVQSSGERMTPMGSSPSGYVNFGQDGRVFFMFTAEGHRDKLDTLIAYTGRYTLDGDKWTTKVEVAWNPAWVGTSQTRQFALQGDTLKVLTPWRVMPNWASKGMTRSIITFRSGR